ncbi:MAG TPA: HAD-IIIA family hydrolase [Chitinophagaceae bacterium]|nr:HAD-IIIA family hydrolase [Chitinophagaceae bacterium]
MPDRKSSSSIDRFKSAGNTEVIILAGGLGTRLREAVPELPKCMAPVAGRPFLFYVINYLRMQGLAKFIFALGYKHEVIEQYLADNFHTLDYQCVIEAEPLGTGGAVQLACRHASSKNVVVTNGDTLFKADISTLLSLHHRLQAICTLALKPMHNMDRYGVVDVDENGIVESLKEKQYYEQGLINGGLYVLDREAFLAAGFPDKFSFETDFLQRNVSDKNIAGIQQEGYFIDIGIPEDFLRAQEEFKRAPLDLSAIDDRWTLFLDRDGVINEDKPGSYIFSPEEFRFMKGGPEIFAKFARLFKYIIVITNQRGIGKGLMTEAMLQLIHAKMSGAITGAGGRLDGIYFASSLRNNDYLRKPNPGMAVCALRDFPGIDLSRSIMVGNNISDMQFGRNAGMYTVFLSTTNKAIRLPHPDIDLQFDSLSDFGEAL